MRYQDTKHFLVSSPWPEVCAATDSGSSCHTQALRSVSCTLYYGSMLEFFDTHCHIQESGQPPGGDDPTFKLWQKIDSPAPRALASEAAKHGVGRLLCIGTTPQSSQQAVEFAQTTEQAWAAIGIHPHEAQHFATDQAVQKEFSELIKHPKVVAVGEVGLDYYYQHSGKADQEKLLRWQLELARKHNLPCVFHIRDAFEDFWPIFDQYKGLQGVVHSFTATQTELDQILARGLYIGLNGIMTFTKNPQQLAAAKAAPLDRILLETDAPFLTPTPYRGTICQPKHVVVTAEFLSQLRAEPLEEFAAQTTRNALTLFNLKS